MAAFPFPAAAARARVVTPAARVGRPVLAQGAGFLQLLAQADDQVFDAGRGGGGRAPPTPRSIGPIDAVEALAVGPVDPNLDRPQADPELAGHGAQGLALAHGGHQGPALLLEVFCS